MDDGRYYHLIGVELHLRSALHWYIVTVCHDDVYIRLWSCALAWDKRWSLKFRVTVLLYSTEYAGSLVH